MDKDIIEKVSNEENNNNNKDTSNKKTFKHYLLVTFIVIVSSLLSFFFVPLIVIVIAFSLKPESRQSGFGAALYDAAKVLIILTLTTIISLGLCFAVFFVGFNGF